MHVLKFKSLVSALAPFLQQVLIEYLVMRHPLSPALAWGKASLTVIALFSFIAVHRLLGFSRWHCRKLLDRLKNSSVNCIVADAAVNTRSDYCTVSGGRAPMQRQRLEVSVAKDACFSFFYMQSSINANP